MTAPELKPCPFCGGKPYLANVEMVGCAYVVCTDCRTQSDDMSKERAITAWNRRTATIPSPLDDPRVKALVEAMIAVAEQSTRDEIPEGYGPEHIEGFDDGYDAAIMKCRAALSAITKEPPHER